MTTKRSKPKKTPFQVWWTSALDLPLEETMCARHLDLYLFDCFTCVTQLQEREKILAEAAFNAGRDSK